MDAAAATSANPRAQRTRAALLSAGLELLAHRPIDAIAIDELVSRAGVAKGSFFNHFLDKQAFANAISREVRGEVEALVRLTNAGIEDPLERLVGGMIAAARYALLEPQRAAILVHATSRMTPADHPINRGLRADLDSALTKGLVAPDARNEGVLFWLVCCQAVMSRLVEVAADHAIARRLVADLARLGLRGLGAGTAIADQSLQTALDRFSD